MLSEILGHEQTNIYIFIYIDGIVFVKDAEEYLLKGKIIWGHEFHTVIPVTKERNVYIQQHSTVCQLQLPGPFYYPKSFLTSFLKFEKK
jgi:hypothetical protein